MKEFGEPARKALNSVGLSNRVAHFPSQLSGGECQRVALARAMVSEPSLILADEPSGNLDQKTGKEIMDLLFKMCRGRGQSLILVTHNHELAKQSDRTLVLSEGRLKRVQST
jgi:putative ABC transport system ATP-binding protein